MKAKITAEPVDVRARRRLRELRTERGLTLQQVAERANIDVSTLSRLEAGKRRLALDHIPALAAALGVSADHLLGAGTPQDPRVHGTPRTHDGLTLWPLTNHAPAGGLHAYKVHISAERTTPPEVLGVHEGHDWLYVLNGRLRLLLGEDDHTIEAGEAVEFTTWTPHWFGAIDGPVELIGLFGPHGERLHLHA
ncbi:MAG: Transcriptional regulator SCO1200, Xre-family with cupin domain [uncultured Solirubrobacteraceae bacterium]|uniref:Transcriptional regulator SCO1200, Xre-family with cupin domain n=1 Tax=uncultured Solirubrobacteraceae bacterium TaxID=1162706 RepID=A0A6J4RYU9_9ACTN|nr:MAG: Transcriptional regulator SCO1200, Xre-family with cupin domain [uncultured Solirubrobacteraceae bacterium]